MTQVSLASHGCRAKNPNARHFGAPNERCLPQRQADGSRQPPRRNRITHGCPRDAVAATGPHGCPSHSGLHQTTMADTKGMFDTQEIQPVKKQHTEFELEMLAIKRKMRERSEERVAHSQKYMQSNPAVTQIIADFFEAALTEQPADFYVFARDHFLGQMRPREPETFDVDTATMEAEILDIMELKAALDACGEDTAGYEAGTGGAIGQRAVGGLRGGSRRRRRRPSTRLSHGRRPLSSQSGHHLVPRRPRLEGSAAGLRRTCGEETASRATEDAVRAGEGPRIAPFACFRCGLRRAERVQGPAPAPLEGEDIFVSDEDPNAKRPRITQGRIDAGASRHEWFEHDGLHCTSFGAVGEACTRCVGGAAVVCVAGADRAGAARRTAFSLKRRSRSSCACSSTMSGGHARRPARRDAHWCGRQRPRRHHTDVRLRLDLYGRRRPRGSGSAPSPTPRAVGAAIDERRGARAADLTFVNPLRLLLGDREPQTLLSSGPSLRAARMALTRSSVASSSCGYLWPP